MDAESPSDVLPRSRATKPVNDARLASKSRTDADWILQQSDCSGGQAEGPARTEGSGRDAATGRGRNVAVVRGKGVAVGRGKGAAVRKARALALHRSRTTMAKHRGKRKAAAAVAAAAEGKLEWQPGSHSSSSLGDKASAGLLDEDIVDIKGSVVCPECGDSIQHPDALGNHLAADHRQDKKQAAAPEEAPDKPDVHEGYRYSNVQAVAGPRPPSPGSSDGAAVITRFCSWLLSRNLDCSIGGLNESIYDDWNMEQRPYLADGARETGRSKITKHSMVCSTTVDPEFIHPPDSPIEKGGQGPDGKGRPRWCY